MIRASCIPTLLALFFANAAPALAEENRAVVASIRPGDLVEYRDQPRRVQSLIEYALSLTTRDLAYTFGSASPEKGGMDCSGTVSHTLGAIGYANPPRMSHRIYLWMEEAGTLKKLEHVYSPNHPTLTLLRPGDLLFWEGTYALKDRNPPISHVMIYLGTWKKDGRGVLFGASSGRRFRGKKIHGVSVFDLSVPSRESKAKLVGFGTPPGLRPE